MSLVNAPVIDRILAVDDSPDNLFLVQTILEDKGYQVSLAEDGMTALAMIEKSPPDLLLLDVMMPGMDGYEVTRRVRQNADRWGFIPILLITAHQQSSVVEGLDAGADDFIRKPVDMDELLARVRSLLRLKHSIDEREQMARQREDFVSRLTHDLRTPLVAADRMLNLFLQDAFGPTPADMREPLEVMIRSNKNLLQMVNTILEVYRHDAGNKTLTFAACDLRELIAEVMQELHPLAAEREIALTMNMAGTGGNPQPVLDHRLIILGDRLELRRVFTNLVGNAIKFTDRGSVTIDLQAEADAEAPSATQWVSVTVKDTGAGIPPDDQKSIFERFRQGNHKRAGSGLGLYLSRRIVEAHHGTITLQSQVGEGSQFTVRLPRQKI